MRLYLIRHGIPVESGYERDGDRPLTEAGRALVRETATAWAAEEPPPSRFGVSPLVRAVQTCELLVSAFGSHGPVKVMPSLAAGSANAVLREVEGSGVSSLALVGHEPQLSSLAAQLLGLPAYPLAFERCAVLALEVPEDGGAAELAFLLHPALPGRAPRLSRKLG